MTTTELGTVFRVEPREVFAGGNGPLADWLAQHLDIAGAALGMDLEAVRDGHTASSAAADVVARDVGRDRIVIFCSQVTASDEHQLGRLITLAGDKSARAVVWVGPELRESHRQALEWFNRHAAEDGIRFYALGLELFRVDDSKPGVVLRLLEAPEKPCGETSAPDAGHSAIPGSTANGVRTHNGSAPSARAIQPVSSAASEPAAIARNGNGTSSLREPGTSALPVSDEIAVAGAHPIALTAPMADSSSPAEANTQATTPGTATTAVSAANGRKENGHGAQPPAGDQQEPYRRFFQRMVDELREKYGVVEAKPALAQNWYSLPSSISGVIYSIWFASNGRIRAELYIDAGTRDLNQEIFTRMQSHAIEIEKEYGAKLEWDATQGGRAYTVSTSVPGKIDDVSDALEKNLKWTIGKLVAFKEVFGRRLPSIVRSIPPKPGAAQRQFPAGSPSR